jgi:hypothetical protein
VPNSTSARTDDIADRMPRTNAPDTLCQREESSGGSAKEKKPDESNGL